MDNLPTVVTFTTEGTAEFTRGDKPAHDMLDDMFAFGDMKRVTDIVMDPTTKRYMVRWLEGPYSWRLHDLTMHYELFQTSAPTPFSVNGATLLFPSYESAVEYERQCLVVMRKNGVIF